MVAIRVRNNNVIDEGGIPVISIDMPDKRLSKVLETSVYYVNEDFAVY